MVSKNGPINDLSFVKNFLLIIQCEKLKEDGCKGKDTKMCEKMEKVCDCKSDVSLIYTFFNFSLNAYHLSGLFS